MPNKRNSKRKEKKKGESPWLIMNFLRRIDNFGYPLPGFNIKGEDRVKTAFGGIMTATVIILTIVYFFNKFNTIADKKNPIMN